MTANKRPSIKDFFGKEATLDSVHKTYTDSPDLFKYVQALDGFIDELDGKYAGQSQLPTDDRYDKEFASKEEAINYLKEKGCKITT